MPIYEYECQKCKTHTEVMQKITDKPLTKCAKCGGRLGKQWSSTSFQLKGSGWYVTDYATKKADSKSESTESKASTKEEKSSKADESTSATTETTTSEKPAASSKKESPKKASSNTSSD